MIAVHFGAGNIGRGFIGMLLNKAGYDVCFVDVNKDLVSEINSRNEYTVLFADEGKETFQIRGVRAIDGQDLDEVAREIAHADIVTTAVGPNILKFIAPAIAKGIQQRVKSQKQPLNIIACENTIGGSTQLKAYVYDLLDESVKKQVESMIGFPDAAVDRIVPLQKNEDPLLVMVEPFFEWVIDQSKIIGSIPAIEGATYVNDLTPFIERKLFTVNTGHAVTAYVGYQYGFQTIEQAITNESIYRITKGALQETGNLLVRKYGFDPQQHEEYSAKILKRFLNPFLSDDVTRVGRSPIRKLSPNDRLVSPAMQALNHGIVPTHLGSGIAAAFVFDHPNDPEAMEIQESIKENGLTKTITRYTGIPDDHELFRIVTKQLDWIKKSRNDFYNH
ncbi:mannitol-1-phosphate 5-dehydrogenase [Fodinisporobacter ferrooxydans]|uniref:Mannitol-1-phosphate 5-dehydrogenase n=1 Tax=Fodinisporobacter ferrooxydans TaxID=2901836 RepID=A0ABY4CH28_9BACL|nr:mannitol-1-phosphate 5-dehydrogenase [Alicyclobacillaceae bacterium MYW30-H2]